MNNHKTKYLIIGGGISGLAFANQVEDYLIVEKENRLGGYCKTTRKNGFVWDYAGHFFHFNTEEYKKMFLDNVQADDLVYQEKCTKIFNKDKLIDYPFQTNIHQLDKQDFIDCLYDLFNKDEKENYDNFLDMLYGKFGKSITEMFLKPYNEKLYACDLTTLDKDAMGRFFPYADKEAIINNMKEGANASYNNTFLYPKQGAEIIIDILAKNLDSNRIWLDHSLTSLDKENKIAIINGKSIQYEYLINTAPLNQFLSTFVDGSGDALKAMLTYNQVLVFNLGFDKKSIYTDEHWLYLPEKTFNFYRIGFYDNILRTDALSMYIEIGYEKDAVIDEEEIASQLDKTLDNLMRMGVITEGMKLIDYEAILMDPAYVHINSECEKVKQAVFTQWEFDNIYSIGRYGEWTYCSMEDCMVSASQLAKRINHD